MAALLAVKYTTIAHRMFVLSNLVLSVALVTVLRVMSDVPAHENLNFFVNSIAAAPPNYSVVNPNY